MKKLMLGILLIGSTVMMIQSCEVNGCSRGDMSSNGQGGNGNAQTQNQDGGGDGSDQMSGNCMNCHGPNGNGEGCFTVGGTVYDSTQSVRNPNAVVMFYTLPNGRGQLVATLDVDGSGNFYTTAVISFGSGLYPAVASKTSSKVQYMPTSTVSGACNSCHGITNAKIWVN